MGSRGPLADDERRQRLGTASRSARRLPALSVALTPISKPPAPPRGLGPAGRRFWREVWESAVWLTERDRSTILALACLEDDLQAYRAAVAAEGVLISEPLQNARGDIIGTRKVPNPAVRMIRDAERRSLDLKAALGLTPSSSARLGLTVVEARSRQQSLARSLAAAKKGSQ
jgi:P27 family predicted phage terminase small subunit